MVRLSCRVPELSLALHGQTREWKILPRRGLKRSAQLPVSEQSLPLPSFRISLVQAGMGFLKLAEQLVVRSDHFN